MIIPTGSEILSSDPQEYCWSNLQRFQNTGFVVALIEELHAPPKKYKNDVRKQANQIRYCIAQAKEYFVASKSVSLATRPVLLYYSIMMFALAEVLLKQSGESSLDAARAHNRHHGLDFKINEFPADATLLISAASLRCTVARRDNKPFGTFELWRRSARQMPLIGKVTRQAGTGLQEGVGSVFFGDDGELPDLPSNCSLLECLKLIPLMDSFLNQRRIVGDHVRATVSVQQQINEQVIERTIAKLTVHPASAGNIEKVLALIDVSKAGPDQAGISMYTSGFTQTITQHRIDPFDFVLPDGVTLTPNLSYLWTAKPYLNEFGLLYVASFMAGNFARYFPDRWMREIEVDSDLYHAVSELTSVIEQRLPILALSELTRCYWVPGH